MEPWQRASSRPTPRPGTRPNDAIRPSCVSAPCSRPDPFVLVAVVGKDAIGPKPSQVQERVLEPVRTVYVRCDEHVVIESVRRERLADDRLGAAQALPLRLARGRELVPLLRPERLGDADRRPPGRARRHRRLRSRRPLSPTYGLSRVG